jgi:hypothetical protein
MFSIFKFWRNPEFIRHRRASLRPVHALSAAAITWFICALFWMSFRASGLPARELPEKCYWALFTIQSVLLILWVLSACTSSIATEKQNKTYDFQRTTSLSPIEFVTGKLLGAPILGYFVFLCILPVTFSFGLWANFRFTGILSAYLLLLLFVATIGLCSLVLSMLMEKYSPGVLVLAFFAMWIMAATWASMRTDSELPGLLAINPIAAIAQFHGLEVRDEMHGHSGGQELFPVLFGQRVSWWLVSALIYLSAATWAVVMLVRNIKRDPPEIRLLTRVHSMLLLAHANILFYAMVNLGYRNPWNGRSDLVEYVTAMTLGVNWVLLFALGLMTIDPPERFRVWHRLRTANVVSYFDDHGPGWPWLLAGAALVFALLSAFAGAASRWFDVQGWHLGKTAASLTLLTVVLVRDVTFVQWCLLTRMKRPLVKGVFFLFLYYFSAIVLSIFANSIYRPAGKFVGGLLTPFSAFEFDTSEPVTLATGIAFQFCLTLLLLRVTNERLGRRPQAAHVAA